MTTTNSPFGIEVMCFFHSQCVIIVGASLSAIKVKIQKSAARVIYLKNAIVQLTTHINCVHRMCLESGIELLTVFNWNVCNGSRQNRLNRLCEDRRTYTQFTNTLASRERFFILLCVEPPCAMLTIVYIRILIAASTYKRRTHRIVW